MTERLTEWLSQLLDRQQHIDSAGMVSRGELGGYDQERGFYQPTPWLSLRTVFRSCGITEDDVFIDLGSGKGRVLIKAAAHPFKRVVGVELAPQLTQIAEANLERNRQRLRCQNVELVSADLIDYEIPSDVTVAYCFNPVNGALFSSLMAKLLDSLDRHPRRLRLIYNHPKEHHTVMQTGRAKLIKDYPAGFMRRYAIRVYDLTPAANVSLTPGSPRVS